MGLILNIDTAVQSASVCLSTELAVLNVKINDNQKDHAAWLHMAIRELIHETGVSLSHVDAIGICAGPGSYTGLRVGMAAVKGLCYALHIPMITVSTLKVMAMAALDRSEALLCPMIDARRMEVFTAVYDQDFNELLPATNMILSDNSLEGFLNRSKVLFFGNGSKKFQLLMNHPNATFIDNNYNASHMVTLTNKKFSVGDFTNIIYSEPLYGKEFYSTFK